MIYLFLPLQTTILYQMQILQKHIDFRFYQFFGLFAISNFAGILGNGRRCFPKDGISEGKMINEMLEMQMLRGKLFSYLCGFNKNSTCMYNSLYHTSILILQDRSTFKIDKTLHVSKHLPVSIVLVYCSVDIFLIIGQLWKDRNRIWWLTSSGPRENSPERTAQRMATVRHSWDFEL